MAEPDYSLAAQIKPPQAPNPLETLIGLENFRRTQAQAQSAGLEAQQKGADTSKLATYGQTGNLQDLRGASPELGVQATQQQSQEYLLGATHRAHVAYSLLNEKDPKRKMEGWQSAGDDWVQRGWIDPKQWQSMRNNPSDIVLNNIIRGSMDIQQHMAATGQTEAAGQAARAPYDFREMPAAVPAGYPAIQPGGPLGPGRPSPVGTIQAPGGPAQGAAPAPPPPVTTGPLGPPAPPNAPQFATSAQSSPADIAQHNANDQYYQEAPSRQIGAPMRTGPGIVNQGTNPLALETAKGDIEKASKISDAASAAARDQAEIGSLRTGLQGAASTGAFTEAKMTVASWIYGATGDPKLAANLTGVNLPALEVFAKDATRRGLTFARQTEGAREAVMAIQIALRANPGLLNTKEGNLKMLDILEAGDKYDQEYSRGAQSYMMKQQDTTGVPHLQGFPDWFIKAHHPAQTVSKAMPYHLPPNPDSLQDGVTYGLDKNKFGMDSGTYDAKTHHFVPVTP